MAASALFELAKPLAKAN